MSDRDRSKDKNGGKKKSGRGWALRVFVLAVVLSALLSFFSTTALEGTGYVVAALVMAVFIGLGIVFDSYNGEAFYNDKMAPVVEELREKGLLIESQGAQVVDLEAYGMPRR